jgi:hypothetical protein
MGKTRVRALEEETHQSHERKKEKTKKKSRCTIMELTSRLRFVNQRKLVESLDGAADVGRRERCRSLCPVITSILRLSWPIELAQAFSDHIFDTSLCFSVLEFLEFTHTYTFFDTI